MPKFHRLLPWGTATELRPRRANKLSNQGLTRRVARPSSHQMLASGSLALLLLSGCHNENFLVGDSYMAQMAPYVEAHTRCPTHDFSSDGRMAIDVFLEDVAVIRAQVALMDEGVTPIVFLSAGAVDEELFGPAITGIILNELAEGLLAIRPDLELYHLDYLDYAPPEFWGFTNHDQHPRWRRVTFERIVKGELGPDGIHLFLDGYVERLMVLIVDSPGIVCSGDEVWWW